MNKVSLRGVEVYPFTSEEQLLNYVDTHKGILVAINAEKILHATPQMLEIINRNIGYCDGAGAMMAFDSPALCASAASSSYSAISFLPPPE